MTKARDIASAAPAPSTVDATEIGYLNGVTSAIQTQLDAKTAKSTLTTTGDIYYASAANTPARLGIGSTGNVLTVASGIPSWAAPAGGGKVLQVVQATYSTSTTIATTTMTDTGLTASITPSSATSKILIFVSQGFFMEKDTSQMGFTQRIMRGATSVYTQDSTGSAGSYYIQGFASPRARGYVTMIYLDSPSTTSSTTYKTQANLETTGGSQMVILQSASMISTITLLEIGA